MKVYVAQRGNETVFANPDKLRELAKEGYAIYSAEDNSGVLSNKEFIGDAHGFKVNVEDLEREMEGSYEA